MASNIIDSYLVALGFSANYVQLRQFNSALANAQKSVANATSGITANFGQWQKASTGAANQAKANLGAWQQFFTFVMKGNVGLQAAIKQQQAQAAAAGNAAQKNTAKQVNPLIQGTKLFAQAVKHSSSQIESWIGSTIKGVTTIGGTVLKVQTGILGFFGGITAGVLGLANNVAQSELGFQMLGTRMMMRTEDAKRMKIALDQMGVSLEDVAWNPELQARFTKYLEQQKKLQSQLGPQFQGQMRMIRNIQSQIGSLQITFQYLGMQLVVSLFNRFGLTIEEVQQRLEGWVNWFLGNVPKVADWIADNLIPVLQDTWGMVKKTGSTIEELGLGFTNLMGLLMGDKAIVSTTFNFKNFGGAIKDIIGFFDDLFAVVSNTTSALSHFVNAITLVSAGKWKDAAKEVKAGFEADSKTSVIDPKSGWGLRRNGAESTLGSDVATIRGADARQIAQQAYSAALRIGSQMNVDPSLIWEQWAHETGGFTNRGARELNNLGGVRYPGTQTYQQYKSVDDFADYYAKMIGSNRYAKQGLQSAHSVQDFAAALKRGGYYEDSYDNYSKGMQNWAGQYQSLANQTLSQQQSYPAGSAQSGKSMTVTQSTSIGDIHVTVTQPGATPDQIAKVVRDTVRTETQKKQQRDLAQLQAAY